MNKRLEKLMFLMIFIYFVLKMRSLRMELHEVTMSALSGGRWREEAREILQL